MINSKSFALALVGAVCAVGLSPGAWARNFNIPGGDMERALDAYTSETGISLIVSDDQIKGMRSKGVHGDLPDDVALLRLLEGTGFVVHPHSGGAIGIVPGRQADDSLSMHVAAASAPTVSGASLETVTVTSSKIGGDVQNIPISITALSQEQLTSTQTAGGPDLIKQVPNMTFTKTNFTGYSIQIRGIGTQAISVTTDPAVAVAFNDIPFIRNHFFEQEFYDVASVEVLRGPQGTLYGRNATAGVVNLESAKPTDQFEAMVSADVGNYQNRRLEAMLNIPIVDDRFDVRIAGEWTKRQGYSLNVENDDRIDGRDLWSGRVTFGLKPTSHLQMYLVWEHFSEDDDRLRSSKQLCATDYGPGFIAAPPNTAGGVIGSVNIDGSVKPIGPAEENVQAGSYFLQGCKAASLYSPEAFGAPLGWSLPFVQGGFILGDLGGPDPYASVTQSRNLRVVDSGLNPSYSAKNDVVELNADYTISPVFTFTSQTGFGHDFLYSAEDYNRFGSVPGVFATDLTDRGVSAQGVFCDPQLGCSNRVILEDLSDEHAWQLSQEFRLTSNFSGPFNFSAGGNYLHYETEENYYVFGNIFTLLNDSYCPGRYNSNNCEVPLQNGFQFNDPTAPASIVGGYVDPNPLSHLNNNGHNYFLSENPYVLSSYAMFGEGNYNIFSDLKLTAGLRWTEDKKHFSDIPSWLIDSGWGYPVARVVNQQWDQLTGRAVANWTPKLDFTDQTLIYGSYAHGYKAGGANPPGAIFSSEVELSAGAVETSVQPVHPLTFKPEFIDAFELGTKNTLLDGALTLNGDVFYYNYQNYQISEIVDRTAINLNFDAHAEGAELETTWEPLPGLRFNFAGGWEDTAIAKGQSAVDLMDRTAGHSDWFVVKPFANEASNCIFPGYVAKDINSGASVVGADVTSYCAWAYDLHVDPFTQLPYKLDPTVTSNSGSIPSPDYPGFDPSTAPNNGAGFSKNVGGDRLPNAPPFTASLGAQYTIPLTPDWAGTLRMDGYWQDNSWWRVFNDMAYDKLHGYATMNLTFIFTSQTGWQVMLYDKNVFNTTAITGAFLNSDDSGLTTSVFTTDPKLIGIRVTKNW